MKRLLNILFKSFILIILSLSILLTFFSFQLHIRIHQKINEIDKSTWIKSHEFYPLLEVAIKSSKNSYWKSSEIPRRWLQATKTKEEGMLKHHLNTALYDLIVIHFMDEKLLKDLYINLVNLGECNKKAIFGFKEASKCFFNKELKELNLSQICELSAIHVTDIITSRIRAENLKKRKKKILKNLLKLNLINKEQFDRAIRSNLSIFKI